MPTVDKGTEEDYKKFLADQALQGVSVQNVPRNVFDPNTKESSTEIQRQVVTFDSGNQGDEYNPRKDLVRVPFVITTEQRVRFYGMGPLQNRGAGNSLNPEGTRPAPTATPPNEASGAGKTRQRQPNAVWKHGEFHPAKQFLALTVNPNQMDINQGLRTAESKTKGGTAQYAWADSVRKTFFDEPRITFSFQTGNIHPLTYMEELKKKGVAGNLTDADLAATQPMPSGYSDWIEFMGLLDEDRIALDGTPNFVYITANSRKFPQITFVGFFEGEPFNIADSAEDSAEMKWQISFIARHTHPRLYNSAELRQMFRENTIQFAANVLGGKGKAQVLQDNLQEAQRNGEI